MTAGSGSDELRAAVRAVLREVLPVEALRAGLDARPDGGNVAVRDDAELDALVRRIATECADPARRAAMAAGRHGYRLAQAHPPDGRVSTAAGPGTVTADGAPTVRIERGAVTERTVQRAASQGARLLLGRRAVLTPLARDRARSLGVAVVKEA